jgi:hypothetical protein
MPTGSNLSVFFAIYSFQQGFDPFGLNLNSENHLYHTRVLRFCPLNLSML